jgi:alkylation response protein AidB-like acyl-CoA dehydrogenase
MPLLPASAAFESDQSALLEAVREFAEHELFPLDRKWDMDESSVAEVLPQLSEMGLLNLLIPAESGGLGCDYRTFAAIIHELAFWSPSTAVTVSVHNMVGRIIQQFVQEPLRTDLLSQWGTPKSFGAFCVSEAGAGSDARSIATTVRETSEGFRINGEKMWVTNGLSAGWLFVLAKLDGAPQDKSYCTFLVRGDSKGLARDKIRGKMGIRGSETAVLHFNDVLVPREHQVGEQGKGLLVCLSTLNGGRISIAAQATGIAEACVSEMVSYARQREQFGKPIGTFQAVGNMIADSVVDLEAARSLIWRAASTVADDHTDRAASAMAKLFASEAANRIAYRAVQVHGGAGYVHECRVEQLYRDARITSIYEGTSEIQRIVLARELAK